MKNQTMFTKNIELQKTAFVTTISIISTMQQHGEDLLKTSLEQNPWLPESSKRACLNMTNSYSKYWENFKSATHQSIEAMEKISSPNRKTEVKESKQTKTTEQASSPRPEKKGSTVRKKTIRVKKTVKASPLPKKEPIIESVATAKQVPLEKPVEKKSEQAKPIQVKAETPILKTSSTSQQKTVPAVDHKKSKEKPSLHTKD